MAWLLHPLTAPVHSCLVMLLVDIYLPMPLTTHMSDQGREGQIDDSQKSKWDESDSNRVSYGVNYPEGKTVSLEREVVDYYYHMESKQEEQESQESQEKEIVKNTHFY